MSAIIHFDHRADLKAIKELLGQVYSTFIKYLNPNEKEHPTLEEFLGAISKLRRALETLGNYQFGNPIAKTSAALLLCAQAAQLRHALVHGDSQLEYLSKNIFGNFAVDLHAFIKDDNNTLDDPNSYVTNGSLFSSSELFLLLAPYDSPEKSLARLDPEAHFRHLTNLLRISTQTTNSDTLAYCWGGMLEAIRRLRELEQQSMSKGPESHEPWKLKYQHIYINSALPELVASFYKLDHLRAKSLHSDIKAKPDFFVTHPGLRKNVQNLINNFVQEAVTAKNKILNELDKMCSEAKLEGDRYIAVHPFATLEQLRRILDRRRDVPAIINEIWLNPNRDADIRARIIAIHFAEKRSENDIWIAQQEEATAEQLIEIAKRNPSALHYVWIHPKRDANVTAAVLEEAVKLKDKEWDKWIASLREATSPLLHIIATRPGAETEVLMKVLENPSTGTDTLKWFVEQNTSNDKAVASHPNTSPAILALIAKRNQKNISVLMAVLGNKHTDADTLHNLLFLAKQEKWVVFYIPISQHPNTSAADLDLLARENKETHQFIVKNKNTSAVALDWLNKETKYQTELASHPNASDQLLRHIAENVPRAHEAVLRNPNATAEILHWFVENHGIHENLIVRHRNTAEGDLNHIAFHTRNPDVLHEILANANATAITITTVVENPKLSETDLIEIAKVFNDVGLLTKIAAHTNANAEVLKLIVDKPTRHLDIDNAVVRNPKTQDDSLRALANRTLNEEILVKIAGHKLATASVLQEVINNTTRSRNIDMIIARNSRTIQSQLQIIAKRTLEAEILKSIAGHQNANSVVLKEIVDNPLSATADASIDEAVVGNRNTNTAQLKTIAARRLNNKTILDKISGHKNAPNAQPPEKKQRKA